MQFVCKDLCIILFPSFPVYKLDNDLMYVMSVCFNCWFC